VERAQESHRVAASLADRIATLTFADRPAEEVTALIVDSIAAWAADNGWRVYRGAASVLPLPPPFQHRRSTLDIAIARPSGAPVVVEVDQTDRRRTVEKLLAEAAAGRIAIWVRWGLSGFVPPPSPVAMVTLPVTGRSVLGQRGRRFSRSPEPRRAAPTHTDPILGPGHQSELFD
jgi:hypothetical protein